MRVWRYCLHAARNLSGSHNLLRTFYGSPLKENLPIYSKYDEILSHAPYQTITLVEVMEHLQWTELGSIFSNLDKLLTPDGEVIATVPIEIGPAIFLKELNRWRRTKEWDYHPLEFLCTLVFGIPGYREDPDKDFMEHKGLDFRHLFRFIQSK